MKFSLQRFETLLLREKEEHHDWQSGVGELECDVGIMFSISMFDKITSDDLTWECSRGQVKTRLCSNTESGKTKL